MATFRVGQRVRLVRPYFGRTQELNEQSSDSVLGLQDRNLK